jgi:hypothetical protein
VDICFLRNVSNGQCSFGMFVTPNWCELVHEL